MDIEIDSSNQSYSDARPTLWALLKSVPSLCLDELKNQTENTLITGLKDDSRSVNKGDLFFAINGINRAGKNFIDQALAKGAIAVLLDTAIPSEHAKIEQRQFENNVLPVIYIYQLAQHISAFANVFYGKASQKMQVVGVTGTNGKTTTTQLVAQWAELLNSKSAIIGTIGFGAYGNLQETINTTPSPILIQQYLADFSKADTRLCAIEVSSHGLSQYRVADVQFSVGAFLNLSRDHLDYHGDMQQYENAKWALFTTHNVKQQVINIDDPIGLKWLQRLPNAIAVSMSFDAIKRLGLNSHRYLQLTAVNYHDKGAQIVFESSWGTSTIESQLLGQFNVANLLVALAILLSLDYPFQSLMDVASQLKPVAGRMEVFTAQSRLTVVVDYAHTPDALEKALQSARIHCSGKLWCVFGCGGDRDKGKRPLMGAIAEQFADRIVITDDNPRTENNVAITTDIVNGLSDFNPTRISVINDRFLAIQYAIEHANPNDVILVAGKGHEDYQIIGTKKHDYSDRLVVEKLIAAKLIGSLA